MIQSNKLFFQESRVAGRKYHDADEVWEDLKIGAKVKLVLEQDNPYDHKAVAIVFTKHNTETNEDEDFMLGYIPRTENGIIASLLQMGWNEIFESRISYFAADAHPEEQLKISIRIKKNSHTIDKTL